MPDVQEVFRMATQKVRPDQGFVERQYGHQRRQSRNRKVGAMALVAALGIAAAVFAIRLGGNDERTKPADRPSPTPAIAVTDHDYVLDLDTSEQTALPESIVGQTDEIEFPAVSPDGSMLAYVKPDANGDLQIFVADLDGAEVRQVTHDREAFAPAWSPDGTKIAYEGYGDGAVHNLFVVDLATGETTQVTNFEVVQAFGTQFAPDGSSLVYAGGDPGFGIRLAPIDGGKHTLLVGGGGDGGDAGDGALSPDGSLLTYAFSSPETDAVPDRYVSNADGTDPRPLVEEGSRLECIPAGTWSPDSTRIVCVDTGTSDIVIVDVATGSTTIVGEGDGAVWLDDHRLLIDV